MNKAPVSAFHVRGNTQRRSLIETPSSWARGAAIPLLCAVFWTSDGAVAQMTAVDKTASNATTHSRVSDGDRVFLRSAAGRLVYDQQLADLARERSSSPEIKTFANDWKTSASRHGKELGKLANNNGVAIPNNMAETSLAQLRSLGQQRAGEFDAGFIRQANETLTQELKLFQDSVRKMENDHVRSWANAALQDLRRLAMRAKALTGKPPQ